MQLPRRHKDAKVHQEYIFNDLFLVQLCTIVPLSAGRKVGGKKILFGAELNI